jgi:hypothetical protein
MRIFKALHGYWDDGEVWVYEGDNGDLRRVAKLDPHLEVLNKSPTGFAWGYGGSGPAQLAFALLAAVVGVERAQDPELYQRFKFDFIAKLDQTKGWAIPEDFIKGWVKGHDMQAQAQALREAL